MEETVQQREYTLTYVQNNELAYVAKCRRWLSEKYQDAGYSIMQMQKLLKRNFYLHYVKPLNISRNCFDI